MVARIDTPHNDLRFSEHGGHHGRVSSEPPFTAKGLDLPASIARNVSVGRVRDYPCRCCGLMPAFDQKTPGFAFCRLLVGYTETQFPRRNTSARVQDFTPIDNAWIDIDESIMIAVVASALNRAQIIANI
jgi:hypothetical protein